MIKRFQSIPIENIVVEATGGYEANLVDEFVACCLTGLTSQSGVGAQVCSGLELVCQNRQD